LALDPQHEQEARELDLVSGFRRVPSIYPASTQNSLVQLGAG